MLLKEIIEQLGKDVSEIRKILERMETETRTRMDSLTKAQAQREKTAMGIINMLPEQVRGQFAGVFKKPEGD